MSTQTQITISNLVIKCTTLKHLKQIHAHILKLHHPHNSSAFAPVLSFAATSNNPTFFNYARAIFQQIQYHNTFMYNNMIRGFMQQDFAISAILCYKEMANRGFLPNKYTFTPLLKACSMVSCDLKKMGLLVHAHLVELGFCSDQFIVSALVEFYSLNLDMDGARKVFDEIPEPDVVLWTTMIDGYGKVGEVERARALFEGMGERNVISWSAIIAAYSRSSDFKEVLSLYRRMEEDGVRPNESVLVSVLTACAHLGALSQGVWIHKYAKRCGYERNIILATALVDMYSKCGCIDLALSVFEGIKDKDSGAWNAIIAGVALGGHTMKSLELFDKMLLSRTKPSEATFVAILTACTHMKLVDKGLQFFERMSIEFAIEPKLEHYASVVDLLAKSGKLAEAEKFIEQRMGGFGRGDAYVWGALLNSCRTYGNVDIGDRIWRALTKMGVTDSGMHVLSYNMYKEAGWEVEAKRVRNRVENTRTKKQPGCSVIEVNGVVEEFLVGDFLHPRAKQVCETLGSLVNVMYMTI
ncbi:hypothetical protein LIER_00749 [Lithospermum erythrorhizon]|uniref:Pentatricopeptide repeat-containing protein n=1 Tax=Lithospermum erythrorhizon TaxID=34254 RepID=A0AAV3NIH9_LITER